MLRNFLKPGGLVADRRGKMAEGHTTDDPGAAASVDPHSITVRPQSHVREHTGELHVCPACDSELVYPTDWAPADRKCWSVSLRCPDCEWHGAGVYDQDVVDRFDEVLDDGTEKLLEDLNLLSKANMEEQIQRFLTALWTDQILPEDF
jgi:hypothetical protein